MKFVEIISELNKKIPSLKVVMIGDGELRKELEAKILSLGLHETIDVVGYKNNPYPILKNSKVMVIPSQ